MLLIYYRFGEKKARNKLETISSFINRFDKKKVDFDGAYGAQCVDLFRQWCSSLGIPHTGAVEGAKDLALRYESLPVEKKYFSLEKSPQAGDAAVWGATAGNPFGHVAIVVSVDGDDILVFEQDGFAQDGCRFAARKCGNLVGCLRFKEFEKEA